MLVPDSILKMIETPLQGITTASEPCKEANLGSEQSEIRTEIERLIGPSIYTKSAGEDAKKP
jgi:hypothetical protein